MDFGKETPSYGSLLARWMETLYHMLKAVLYSLCTKKKRLLSKQIEITLYPSLEQSKTTQKVLPNI